MSYFQLYEHLDQERCIQQSDIAETLYVYGFSDGLSGTAAERYDEPYRQGYCEGFKQRLHQFTTTQGDGSCPQADEF